MKLHSFLQSSVAPRLLAGLVFFISFGAFGQDPIVGNTTPALNAATTYSFTSDIHYFATKPTWSVTPSNAGTTGPVFVTPDRFGSSCSITFVTNGAATISISYGGNTLATLNVVVGPPLAPTFSMSPSGVCSSGSVEITGIPNGGDQIRWYTQQTGGTHFAQSLTYTTPVLSTSTDYYISAYNTSSGLESTTRTKVTVTVNPLPSAPVNPNAPFVCGEGMTTLSVTPGSEANSAIWYNAAEGGEVLATGTSYEVLPSRMKPTDFYAASFNTTTGCISSTRTQLSARAWPEPETYVVRELVYGSGSTILIAGTSEADMEVRWYASKTDADQFNTNFLGTGLSFQTPTLTATTTYWIRASSSTTSCVTAVMPGIVEVIPLVPPSSVRRETIRIEGVKSETSIGSLTESQKSTNVVYMDGMGRPVQSVASKATPKGYDLVQPVEYDTYGRTSKSYLPYATKITSGDFHSLYKSEQASFYILNGDMVENDVRPFAVSVFDSSPLGRLVEQGGVGEPYQPGNSGTPRTTRVFESFNTGATTGDEAVRILAADGTSVGFYGANKLLRYETIDPQGNREIKFTNLTGQTICSKKQSGATTFLVTYYHYDSFGRLAFILQPAGVYTLGATWTVTQAIRDNYFFFYRYDARGRVIEKQTPGAGWDYIVYDQLNRPVLTQDAKLRATDQWAFVKYDVQSRSVLSGLYTSISSRATLQEDMDQKNYDNEPYYEKRGIVNHGYTNVAFPTSDIEFLAASYYDNRDFNFAGGDDVQFITNDGIAAAASSHGLPTGNKVLIDGTTNWMTKYLFHDKFGRVIQVRHNNHLNPSNVSSRITTIYDFEKVTWKKVTHDPGGSNITTTITLPEYDAAGRVVRLRHGTYPQTVDGLVQPGSLLLVAQYKYNELGQLVDKKLHGTGTLGSEDFLQSIDYRYNIKGQLRSINNSQLILNDDNDDTDDFFGMQLIYDQSEAYMGVTRRFDGKIAAMKWKAPGTASGVLGQRGYTFTYDQAGRLTLAGSKTRNSYSWDIEAGVHTEQVTYDESGNIKSLNRSHRKYELGPDGIPRYVLERMDELMYDRDASNKNKLLKVTDTALPAGFNNGTSGTTNDYTYDAKGNLTSDMNKGIDTILYNYLNKPIEVLFTDQRKITYHYDAAGTKLSMKAYASATATPVVTDYIDNFVYVNGVLQFFGMPEGRVVKNGSTFEYQYAITDHQGNVRVLFTSTAPVVETAFTDFETTSTDFNNFPSGGNLRSESLYNNTAPTGTKSQLLNGGYSSRVGVGKSFAVYPGDKIKIRAWAKYESNSISTPGVFADALLSAFSVSAPAPGEKGTPGYALSTWGGMVDGGRQARTEAPEAGVNIIAFDRNYDLIDAAYDQVHIDAEQVGLSPDVPHDEMVKELIIKEAGYVYVYVSNNSPYNVYFDDVEITYTPTRVIQYNEYYPYGLQASTSWTRGNHKNDYLYNAASELNATTGWYEMFYRNYDPAIGRMLQVDPYAAMYPSLSPYNYAENNPVMMNDPSGGKSEAPPGVSVSTWNRLNRLRGDASFSNAWAFDWGERPILFEDRHRGGNIITDRATIREFFAHMAAGRAVGFHFDKSGGLIGMTAYEVSLLPPPNFYASTGPILNDPIFGHDLVDPKSFNLQPSFGKYLTEAYYAETFLVAFRGVRLVDILRLELNSIAIKVNGNGMSYEDAQEKMADAFQDARIAVYDAFEQQHLTYLSARSLFLETLERSINRYFPENSSSRDYSPNYVEPNMEFTFEGDVPISVIQLIDPRIFPTY